MSHSHRELLVWQKSMALVKAIYRETRSFPREEVYGLSSQMRRAAVSVPCNIAERQGRMSKKEFKQFLALPAARFWSLKRNCRLRRTSSFSALILHSSSLLGRL
jgi:23S rRNA-intervening sequence protein